MHKGKIDNITIYSQSKLVQNLLTQTCKNFSIKTFSYSSLASIALNRLSISVIDVKNQIVFDSIIKAYLDVPIIYPVIMLISEDVIIPKASISDSIIIISKPLRHDILSKTISSCAINSIYRITHNIFLDIKTFNIIKILYQKKIEIKLTHLEYKILKYLIEISETNSGKAATEKEILINVFGYNSLSNTSTLKMHIHRLKQKLGTDSHIIERKNNQYAICFS